MRLPDLSLTPDERRLLNRAAGWPGHDWADVTAVGMTEIARCEGIDFATALLYDRLRRSPRHGPFIEKVEALPEPHVTGRAPCTVAVVPGAFFAEKPETGADGSFVFEQAAALGWPVVRVPLESFGCLRENVGRLCDWLTSRGDEPLVLVSLSKGGAEVRLALAEAPRLFAHVMAWIDVSGLGLGTPIVNWLFHHPLRTRLVRLLFWWRGYSFTTLSDLQRGPAGLLDDEWRVPAHLAVVHVVGFPLARHLSRPLARRGHRRLAPLGPNDGGTTLLADLARLPGFIYPVWGADHYLRPRWDLGTLLRRLIGHFGQEGLGAMPSLECGQTACRVPVR